MFDGIPPLHIAGQLLLAFLFLGTGLVNSVTKVQQHVDRMEASGVPFARPVLYCGFVLQFAGGLMLLVNWHRDVAAGILIVFVVLASAMFHRFWEVEDPLRRHFHVSFLFVNCGVIGGLLLVM